MVAHQGDLLRSKSVGAHRAAAAVPVDTLCDPSHTDSEHLSCSRRIAKELVRYAIQITLPDTLFSDLCSEQNFHRK